MNLTEHDLAVRSIGEKSIDERANPYQEEGEGELDPFSHSAPFKIEISGDPHEDRARELEAIGDHVAADRIRYCSNESFFPQRLCRRRDCPTCSKAKAKKYADDVRSCVAMMACPHLYLLTCPSMGLHDLSRSITTLRTEFNRLRRQKPFREVRGGVGLIEPKLCESGDNWNTHVHLILDVDDLDVGAVNCAWQRLTNGRGRFSIAPDPRVRRDGLSALAAYVTKPDTWSPTPGRMAPPLLDLLRDGIRGRQLVVRFGSASNRGHRSKR